VRAYRPQDNRPAPIDETLALRRSQRYRTLGVTAAALAVLFSMSWAVEAVASAWSLWWVIAVPAAFAVTVLYGTLNYERLEECSENG